MPALLATPKNIFDDQRRIHASETDKEIERPLCRMKLSMENVEQIMAEVTEASQGMAFALLVVGFEGRTEFIQASDPGAQTKLQSLLVVGGELVGMIGAVGTDPNRLVFCTRPLRRYESEPWVQSHLHHFVESTAHEMVRSGLGKVGGIHGVRPGLN